jgi:hypothetical protein
MQTESTSISGSSQRTQLIVLLSITTLILVGVWFAWSTFAGNSVPVGKEIDVGAMRGGRGAAYAANRIRARAQQNDITQQPDGIRPMGVGQVSVKSGDYFTQLPEAADAPDNVRLYTAQNLISGELDMLLRARVEIASNPKVAEQLQISKEQIEKLTKIPLNRGAGLRLDKNDRDEIKTLWKSVYTAPAGAPRDAATQTLLAKIREIGDRTLEPTRQLMNKRGDDIKAILTPEQLQKYLSQR